MASPPFNISITTPASSDNINLFPGQNGPQMDIIESWLLAISTNMGVLRGTAMPDPFEVISTSASESSGPYIGIYRASPSPAADDVMGKLIFYGKNDADSKIEYGDITCQLNDPSASSEDGTLLLRICAANVENVLRVRLNAAGVTTYGNFVVDSGTSTLNGNTSVAGTLSVSGALSSGAQTVTGNVGVTGNITASGSITASSDKRLKSNIKPLHDALSRINRLQGVSYVVKATGVPNIGLIAQDVAEVLPEVVVEDANGYLAIAYGNIVAVLVEAVKELSAKVAALEAKA